MLGFFTAVLAGMAIAALINIIVKIATATVKKVIEIIKGLKKASGNTVLIRDHQIAELIGIKIKEGKEMKMDELEELENEEDEEYKEYVVAASLDEENNIKDMKIIESEKVSEKLDSLLMANNNCIYLTD